MVRMRCSYGFRYALAAVGCALAALFATPVAADDADGGSAAQTLTDIGIEFDWARLRPLAERQTALEAVASSIEELLRGDLPSSKKGAAHFLSAEVRLAMGDYEGAANHFAESAKKGKKESFADDAVFGEIIALQARGRDEDAAKRWKKWEKHHGDSPLLGEALLARSWNALRRDSLREAKHMLERHRREFPHAVQTPRVALAQATIAYLEGRNADAMAAVDRAGDGVAATYLLALCLESEGQMLKAAAQYQQVVERFPASTLRDHAMLAKANIFLRSGAYRSAIEEFTRVVESAQNARVRAEADVRAAACTFLDGDEDGATEYLRRVAMQYAGSEVAARAQLLLGEVLISQGLYEESIVELNRVLSDYFEHELAANAQYRVGRCLDALGRHKEATSAYQLVVSGYPLAPQSPAAAYLAGIGLLEQNRPQAAVPFFQLVLDRYARDEGEGAIDFASPEHQELVEASLCLLELSYHRIGNLGQLSGVPHQMLQRMPPSSSPWRAYALLIDADALAAQARYEEAEEVLRTLIKEFPEHKVGIPANRLLAWTYARQGHDELAIQTEERMLARYAAKGETDNLASAYLNKAHILFNRKNYKEAASTYDDFLRRFPGHPKRLLALYQAGLCHLRLDHTGNAVDRWEELVATDPAAEIAERAWVRAGDVYFQTEHYDDAKRCYQGLLDHFVTSRGAALGMLRMAQCDYNAGRDAEALEAFSGVVQRYPQTGIAREAARGIERALYRLGQRGDGGEVLAELVAKYPNSAFAADAQFEIGMRHYEAKQYAEAAEEFRRVISQFPSYSSGDRAHYLMADAYSKAGAAQDARLAYEQFLNFFPDSELRTTVRFRLGSIRFDEEDYMRAAVDFTTVMEDSTSKEMAAASLFNLALCRRMLGENEVAKDLLERYRATYGRDERAGHVAYHLGDYYENATDYERASKEYDIALNNKTNRELRVELRYRAGVCYEQLGKDKEAIESYKKAMLYKKRSHAFRLSAVARCAALYEKSSEFKLALAAYRDLIRNAEDPELVVAAKARASQLEAAVK